MKAVNRIIRTFLGYSVKWAYKIWSMFLYLLYIVFKEPIKIVYCIWLDLKFNEFYEKSHCLDCLYTERNKPFVFLGNRGYMGITLGITQAFILATRNFQFYLTRECFCNDHWNFLTRPQWNSIFSRIGHQFVREIRRSVYSQDLIVTYYIMHRVIGSNLMIHSMRYVFSMMKIKILLKSLILVQTFSSPILYPVYR